MHLLLAQNVEIPQAVLEKIQKPLWQDLLNYGVLGGFAALVITLFVYPLARHFRKQLDAKSVQDAEIHELKKEQIIQLREDSTANRKTLETLAATSTASQSNHEKTRALVETHGKASQEKHDTTHRLLHEVKQVISVVVEREPGAAAELRHTIREAEKKAS